MLWFARSKGGPSKRPRQVWTQRQNKQTNKDKVLKEFRRQNLAGERGVTLQAHQLVGGAGGAEHPPGASPEARALTPPAQPCSPRAAAAPQRRRERTPGTAPGLRLAAAARGGTPREGEPCALRRGERVRPTKQGRR